MRVLLVDDHSLMLEGLRNLLTVRGFDVVGTASDGLQALDAARTLRPDVILMDIQMPRCDGLEATRLIKAEMPDVRIVILTMSGDDQHLFEAVKHGASGYLLKNMDADEFYRLLDQLARNEVVISPQLAGKLMAEFAQRAQTVTEPEPAVGANHRAVADEDVVVDEDVVADEGLTPRQREVLALVAQGYTNREIAARLVITERTVKYHVSEILQTLHLRNRAQVIAYTHTNQRNGLSP